MSVKDSIKYLYEGSEGGEGGSEYQYSNGGESGSEYQYSNGGESGSEYQYSYGGESGQSGESGYEYEFYGGSGERGQSGESGYGGNIVNTNTVNVNSSNNSNSLTLNAETIQIAYVVYYGRPADVEGREFWGKVFSDNQVSYSPMKGDMLTGNEGNLYSQIVNQFGASEEADLLFGRLSYREMIDRVYNFAFDRNAEATGLNYWTEQLQNGSITVANFALEVALGAQNEDILTLTNKIKSADLFSSSIDTQREIEAYQGSSAAIMAREWLNDFGSKISSQSQVDSALQELELAS